MISVEGLGKGWVERGRQLLAWGLVGEFVVWLTWGPPGVNKGTHGHGDEEFNFRPKRLKVFCGVAKWWFWWLVECITMGEDKRSVGGINLEGIMVPEGWSWRQMSTDIMVGDTQLIQEKTRTQDTLPIYRCKDKSEVLHSSMVSCVRSTLPPLFLCMWVSALLWWPTYFNKGKLM